MFRHTKLLLSLLLSMSACNCEDTPEPLRTAAPGAQGLTAEPLPPGVPLASSELARVMPTSLAGFTALAPAEGHERKVPNGGTLRLARRQYEGPAGKLLVELTDSLHAPAIRKIMEHQHDADNPIGEHMKPLHIKGHPGLSQMHTKTATAIVNVLVAKRLLFTVKLHSTDTLEHALEFAEALDYGAALALLPEAARTDAGARKGAGAGPAATGATKPAAAPQGESDAPSKP